jgi:hypothetical protein
VINNEPVNQKEYEDPKSTLSLSQILRGIIELREEQMESQQNEKDQNDQGFQTKAEYMSPSPDDGEPPAVRRDQTAPERPPDMLYNPPKYRRKDAMRS